MPAQPFQQFMREHGARSRFALSQKARVAFATVSALDAGKLAPNHPCRVLIARALGVNAEALADYCKGPALPPRTVRQIRTWIENRGKRGTALVRVGKDVTTGKRNSLKRQRFDVRQAVREMLTTTNLAVLKGDRYVNNLRTEALFLVLTDYAERRGIKVPVVLNPQFSELFD